MLLPSFRRTSVIASIGCVFGSSVRDDTCIPGTVRPHSRFSVFCLGLSGRRARFRLGVCRCRESTVPKNRRTNASRARFGGSSPSRPKELDVPLSRAATYVGPSLPEVDRGLAGGYLALPNFPVMMPLPRRRLHREPGRVAGSRIEERAQVENRAPSREPGSLLPL
jgi:hypothetical protein